MTASRERLAAIVRESLAPVPTSAADLEPRFRRIVEDRARRAGVSADEYLAAEREARARAVERDARADEVMAAVRR